jgi:hypothetical protein
LPVDLQLLDGGGSYRRHAWSMERFATADKWQAFAVNFLEISPGAEVAEIPEK